MTLLFSPPGAAVLSTPWALLSPVPGAALWPAPAPASAAGEQEEVRSARGEPLEMEPQSKAFLPGVRVVPVGAAAADPAVRVPAQGNVRASATLAGWVAP